MQYKDPSNRNKTFSLLFRQGLRSQEARFGKKPPVFSEMGPVLQEQAQLEADLRALEAEEPVDEAALEAALEAMEAELEAEEEPELDPDVAAVDAGWGALAGNPEAAAAAEAKAAAELDAMMAGVGVAPPG